MATIVLGYDASPGAERALDTALEIATHFGDRLLIAFGAAPPGPPTDEAGESTGTRSRSWVRGSRPARSDGHGTRAWRPRWSWCRSGRRPR